MTSSIVCLINIVDVLSEACSYKGGLFYSLCSKPLLMKLENISEAVLSLISGILDRYENDKCSKRYDCYL
jgi:hypothetical protein